MSEPVISLAATLGPGRGERLRFWYLLPSDDATLLLTAKRAKAMGELSTWYVGPAYKPRHAESACDCGP